MKKPTAYLRINNETGATAVIVAISLFAIIAFAALAIDLGHLYVTRNELQNAADAGALAGAAVLYTNAGTVINTGANQVAYDAATANASDGSAVEVNWSGGNADDVQRGHWCFGLTGNLARGFYPNYSTDPVDLWDVATEDLDANQNFINAVRVITRRNDTPVLTFFARVFGIDSFRQQADAVAYIGFAGSLTPFDVDQPIAICEDSILFDGKYSCNIGRMINSGSQVGSSETGGWTSFNQNDPCTGGTNAQEVKSLVCGNGNPEIIALGADMATNGGEIQSAFNELIDCWNDATNKTKPWTLTLPVISCPDNNVGTCQEVTGAVVVNIVWITDGGEDPGYNNAPTQMEDWSSSDPDGSVRWTSFVNHFNLKNVDGTDAPYAKKSIYFKPDCTSHEPMGTSGGNNFGILAKIPVLVQ